MAEGVEVLGDAPGGPVSVVVTRRIKPGCEKAYEELVTGIHESIKAFDGYLGSHILVPPAADTGTTREYRIIFRFDTPAHLKAWEGSAERREWLDRMAGMIEGAPHYHVITGLETWFTLPGAGAIVPPPRYKMVAITLLAVFPLLTGFNYASQPLLSSLPIWLRVLIGSVIVVPVMTYVVMPRMTRLFQAWLYPGGAQPLVPHARGPTPEGGH